MDPPDRARCTPLYRAAIKGGVDTVQLLLERGADVTVKNLEQRSVLHAAVLHSGVMELLLKVCDKNCVSFYLKVFLSLWTINY